MASYTMVPASAQGLTMGSRRDAKYCLCKSTAKLAWFLHHRLSSYSSPSEFSSYPGLNCSRNHRIHWQGNSVSRWKAGNQELTTPITWHWYLKHLITCSESNRL
ncbi:hypothetical protein YC2023_097403 [Brassica napus]